MAGRLSGILTPSQVSIISDASLPKVIETRTKWFGMSLGQREKDKGGKRGWPHAKEPILEIASLLKAHGGLLFLGKTMFYRGFLNIAKRMDNATFQLARICLKGKIEFQLIKEAYVSFVLLLGIFKQAAEDLAK